MRQLLILAMIKLPVLYKSYNILTRNIQGILQSYEVFYRVWNTNQIAVFVTTRI